MGVFTTKTLLNSVGVSRNTSASGAVAINWILKVTILLVVIVLAFLDRIASFVFLKLLTLKKNCNIPLDFISFGCKRMF